MGRTELDYISYGATMELFPLHMGFVVTKCSPWKIQACL